MIALILIHAASTFFLTGLIWVIQLVHYPSFHFVDSRTFKDFHHFHSNRITWIVAPVMLIEIATAAWICYQDSSVPWIVNLVSVACLWALTGLVSVPIHNQLASADNAELSARLTKTNWPRTLLWSARSAALLWFLLIVVKL